MSFANDDMPLVSNILPVINRAGTIRRCIDSLLAQDYPNFEIIVQDAASTDGTLEILKSYGDKIQLFSEPDSGPEEGRCRAKKRAKGDIVSYCYSDEEFSRTLCLGLLLSLKKTQRQLWYMAMLIVQINLGEFMMWFDRRNGIINDISVLRLQAQCVVCFFTMSGVVL